jgi:hypothetical protein
MLPVTLMTRGAEGEGAGLADGDGPIQHMAGRRPQGAPDRDRQPAHQLRWRAR